LDKVSVFGIHPPELHWIDSIEEYFKWMVLSQRPPAARRNRDDVSEDLTVTPLTDGGLQTVKFRQRYLTEAVEACRQGCGSSGVYASHAAMVGFLERLQQAVVNRHGEALVQRFVESRPKHNAKEVVIVFSAVKPDSPHKFFIHLLYRFGRFICDMDLFTVSSLCESFSRAGLLNEHPDDDSAATARDADWLLHFWARRELFNGSYTTKAFGTALERAHEYIHDVFFGRMFHVGGVPLVDMASMAWELTEQVTAAWAERRKRLAETLVGCVNISAAQRGPLVEELKRSTLRQPYLPLSAGAQPQGTGPPAWEPGIRRAASVGQTLASFNEQTEVYEMGCEILDAARSGLTSWVPGLLLVGMAGSGKTHVLRQLALYAMGLGFDIEYTALQSRKALQFGGVHVHKLFNFEPRHEKQPPHIQAKAAVSSLSQAPGRWALLQVTHCLFIEEVGLLSAQTIAAMDIVLRVIRNNQVPFGGAVVMASGAVPQLAQLNGDTFWSSTLLITSFRVALFEESIRYLNREHHELVCLMEKPQSSPADIARAWQIVEQNCNFVDRWDDIPNAATMVFGKQEAEKAAVQRYIRRVQQTSINVTMHTVHAVDETFNMPGRWQPTRNRRLVQRIAKKVSEPDQLTVWDGACMRFSSNLKTEASPMGACALSATRPTVRIRRARTLPCEWHLWMLTSASFRPRRQPSSSSGPSFACPASTRLRTFSIRE